MFDMSKYTQKPDEVRTIRIVETPYCDPEDGLWKFSADPEIQFHSMIYYVGRRKLKGTVLYPSKATRPQDHLSKRQKLITALEELRGLEDRYGDVPELNAVFDAAETARCLNEI